MVNFVERKAYGAIYWSSVVLQQSLSSLSGRLTFQGVGTLFSLITCMTSPSIFEGTGKSYYNYDHVGFSSH